MRWRRPATLSASVAAFFSWRNFRRMPTAVPGSVMGYLGL